MVNKSFLFPILNFFLCLIGQKKTRFLSFKKHKKTMNFFIFDCEKSGVLKTWEKLGFYFLGPFLKSVFFLTLGGHFSGFGKFRKKTGNFVHGPQGAQKVVVKKKKIGGHFFRFFVIFWTLIFWKFY